MDDIRKVTPKSLRGRPPKPAVADLPPVPPGTSPTPDHIRSSRLDANLSQKTAAAMIYRHITAWQKWEAGNNPMPPADWELFNIKLAAYLKSNRSR